MGNRKQYDKPDIKIKITGAFDIIATSELTNIGSASGGSGGLPEVTDLKDN